MVTISVDKATQMFGEKKKKKMKNTKQFMNKYYKPPVFSPPEPVPPTETVRENYQEIVPFEDQMGFTKNWNFESERQNFYEPEEDSVPVVTKPIEVRTTTVPYVRKLQYSDNWDRTPSQNRRKETSQKYIKRKYDIRVPH